MKTPENLKYSKEHEWVKDNGDGTATVGITDFAQSELGDIVFVELEEVGYTFVADDIFGTVEAVKTVSELFAPIDGEVIEINEALEDNPELVNEDPFGEGWMVKIKITDSSQLGSLLNATQYSEITA